MSTETETTAPEQKACHEQCGVPDGHSEADLAAGFSCPKSELDTTKPQDTQPGTVADPVAYEAAKADGTITEIEAPAVPTIDTEALLAQVEAEMPKVLASPEEIKLSPRMEEAVEKAKDLPGFIVPEIEKLKAEAKARGGVYLTLNDPRYPEE